MNVIRFLRALIMRIVFPSSGYFLATRNLKPLSRKFGFDRGTPIDRFWIESFLKEHATDIKGRCLEIGDNRYTKQFGQEQITRSDILDVAQSTKHVTIVGDLRNLKKKIKDNTYDCIILTHVLGLIDDYDAAVSECFRILKKGGVLLVTSSCLSPTYDVHSNYWRFTPVSFKYIFSKYFKKSAVGSYGNVLTGQAFWVGMAQEELTPKQLAYNDPQFPCIVTFRGVK